MARLLAPRMLNLFAFLACVVAMAGALYLEHVEGLDPCPLCIFQRVGVIAAGLFFLLALIHNPAALGQRIYAALAAIGAIGGGAVAARHVWLQSLPADQVPACGPALDYMMDVFPMGEVLRMVFTGSGECAEIDWLFLGISLPAWSLLVFIGLSATALFQLFRRHA
ncbi:MAG: disulfide bond formation protein B [Gammaproteobacteria bacterium HGW-Gammaproteobacteria-14]|nr:MAG: disulfide bond formation protein B [Gammaproteobacteria bacterium HGW-Gammaproteobacteria-14]